MTGSISAVRIRVAHSDWWASRRVVSVMPMRLARKTPLPCSPWPRPALDARDVAAGARVDPHELAFLDEQRHLDHDPRLEGGRLGASLGGIAAQAWVGLGDGHLHVIGRLDHGRHAVPRD